MEQRLREAAGRIPDATAPPDLEVLHAGRRRRRGRLAGAAAALTVLVAGSAVALSPDRRDGGQQVRMIDDPDRPEPTPSTTSVPPTTDPVDTSDPTPPTTSASAPDDRQESETTPAPEVTADPVPPTTPPTSTPELSVPTAPVEEAEPQPRGPYEMPTPAVESSVSVEPAAGPPGTVIRVSGAGCTLGGGAVVGFTRNGRSVIGDQRADADAQGYWSIEFVVPTWFSSSDHLHLAAGCSGAPGPGRYADVQFQRHFYYNTVPFRVQ